MDLSSVTIYTPNDMVNSIGALAFERYAYNNYEVVTEFPSIEFSTNFILKVFFLLFDHILAMNGLMLFFTILNLFLGVLLINTLNIKVFKRKKSFLLPFIFALFLVFNNYYIYRLSSFTPNLFFVGIIFLFIILALSKLEIWKLLLLAFIGFTFSVYYTIFGLQIYFVLKIFEFITERKSLKELLFSVLSVSILSIFYYLLIQFHLRTYIGSSYDGSNLYRPIEDFYSFRYNPKLMVVPPNDAIFLSRDFLNFITVGKSDEYESSGIFLGWHYLLAYLGSSVLSIWFLYKRKLNSTNNTLLKLTGSTFVIILLALPPIVVVKDLNIYMPSYFLYNITPFIRVLARYAVVVNTLLILNIYILTESILRKYTNYTKFKPFIYAVLFLLHVLFNSVEISILDVKNPPKYVNFLLSRNEKTIVYVSPIKYYDKFWFIGTDKKIVESTIQVEDAIYLERVSTIRYCENKNIVYQDEGISICVN